MEKAFMNRMWQHNFGSDFPFACETNALIH